MIRSSLSTSIPTRQDTFKKQGTHRHGKCKTIQDKLMSQGKRDQKVTKWSVKILESGVGREGFVDLLLTLWKEVPEEIM